MDAVNAAVLASLLEQFIDKHDELKSLAADIAGGPAPTEETDGTETYKVKLAGFYYGLIKLGEDIESLALSIASAEKYDNAALSREINRLLKETGVLENKISNLVEIKNKQEVEINKAVRNERILKARIEELEKEVETLKSGKEFMSIAESLEYLKKLTPWVEKMSTNVQTSDKTGERATRHKSEINNEQLVADYLAAGSRISKEIKIKYGKETLGDAGLSPSGIRKRLVNLGYIKE